MIAVLIMALIGEDAANPDADSGGPAARARPAPIVIGHRGASGYRPEHTLASYELAIDLGADFIEPDLVSTRDGRLVARHENELSGTTDVSAHPEFASRRAAKTIDGTPVSGWFTEDFTLAELKTLRARERLPELRRSNTAFDGQFEIPTLEEIIQLAQRESRARGRVIGLYPETKHPSYFEGLGLPLEAALLRALHAAGYRERKDPVFIQSFETRNLRTLRGQTKLRLVQLIDASGAPYDAVAAERAESPREPLSYADMLSDAGLARIAQYADGIGVNKTLLLPRDAEQRSLAPTQLVERAHRHKLLVHPWTFRAENVFLPGELRIGQPSDSQFAGQRGDLREELKLFFRLGVDGVFVDHPDVAVAVRAGLGPR
jgi:glycerophosphoryl diester phosphodiesterase